MKRTTLLVLTYAILFSMAAVSFSLYHTTVTIKTVAIESKVFDISQTATVNDSQYLENTPTWMFMVFNTAAISGSDYDTNVQVALSSAITNTNLQVAIYDTNNVLPLAVSSFTNGIANLIVPRQFLKGTVSKVSLYLQYSYNGKPISAASATSPANIPFAAGSVNASVTVWGSSPNDQAIIDGVLANHLCSANLSLFNSQKMNVSGYLNGKIMNTDYKKIGNGTITINFTKTTLSTGTTGTLTISQTGETTIRIDNIILSYINPNTVVIQNLKTDLSNNFTISNFNLNGTVYAGSYLGTSAIQTELFRNFQTNADGSFDVSFDYSPAGSGTNFSINFGYAQ